MSVRTVPTAPSQASRVQTTPSPGAAPAWLVEDYAVPLVAFDFAFPGGAAQDPAGKDGAAAMLAALLDEGAGDLEAEAFHRALDDKAIELSFSADRDFIFGRLKCLSRHVDAAFDLLGLALSKARFDREAVERIRAQMIAGLKREASDPDALVGEAFREAAFPGHPYGRSEHGALETLPEVSRDDLVLLRDRLIARGGAVIATVGAIDRARLSDLIDRAFAPLPAAPALEPVAQTTVQGLGEFRRVDLDVPQSTIRFGLPGVPRRDPEHMAAAVVNHILGGGVFSARLFKEVREKRGLAYSVHSQLVSHQRAALFVGGTATKNERAGESLSVIEEEIAKLAEEGPSPEELDKAKKYMIGSYALRFDTSTKIASHLVHLQTEGFPIDYLDRRNREIADVSLEDARRAARRLFGGKKLLVAVAGRPIGLGG